MKGMPGGMQALMKQANQMQNKMKKLQEELASREYEGQAGGGAVKVRINGDHMLLQLDIDPEVFKSGDIEMLQDLVIAATNEAQKICKETSSKEMNAVTGGMNIPGMF